MASGRSCVCHSKRCAQLIASAITRSEFMRHKTHAKRWRAMPQSGYPKNNLILFGLSKKIIARTFLKLRCPPTIRDFIHSFEGHWLASDGITRSDSSTCSNVLLYSLMLQVGPASRRSSPQGKPPTSQAEPCRRDHNGSRCRRAYPTWGREAAEGARGVDRSLDLFARWDNSLEFGWSQGHRETRHS